MNISRPSLGSTVSGVMISGIGFQCTEMVDEDKT